MWRGLDYTLRHSPPGTGPMHAAAQACALECRGDQETAEGTPCRSPAVLAPKGKDAGRLLTLAAAQGRSPV